MIQRYKIDADETLMYNACVVATPVENGEWVKYEDIESMLKFVEESKKLFEECINDSNKNS